MLTQVSKAPLSMVPVIISIIITQLLSCNKPLSGFLRFNDDHGFRDYRDCTSKALHRDALTPACSSAFRMILASSSCSLRTPFSCKRPRLQGPAAETEAFRNQASRFLSIGFRPPDWP